MFEYLYFDSFTCLRCCLFAVSSFGVLQVGCLSPTLLFVSILTFFERGKDFSMVFSFQFIFSRLLNAISFSFINKFDSVENNFLLLISIFSPTFSSKQLTFYYIEVAQRFLSVNSPPLHQGSFLQYFLFFVPLPTNSEVINYLFLPSRLRNSTFWCQGFRRARASISE